MPAPDFDLAARCPRLARAHRAEARRIVRRRDAARRGVVPLDVAVEDVLDRWRRNMEALAIALGRPR